MKVWRTVDSDTNSICRESPAMEMALTSCVAL